MAHAERPRAVPAPRRAAATAQPPSALPSGDRIVVAVDGSPASVRALVWALRRGTELGVRVEALTTWPLHGPVFIREVAGHFCEPRWRAREVQADAVARALAVVDDAPPYELHVLNADLVDALVRASVHAVHVVVGSDGPVPPGGTRRRLSERVVDAIPDRVVVIGPEGPEDQVLATSDRGGVREPPAR